MDTGQTNTNTEQMVHDICNDLLLKKQSPKSRLVLSMLPTIKSISTVHKYIKSWEIKQEANKEAGLQAKSVVSSNISKLIMVEMAKFEEETEQRLIKEHQAANKKQIFEVEKLQKALKQAETAAEIANKAHSTIVGELDITRRKLHKANLSNLELLKKVQEQSVAIEVITKLK